VDRIAAHYHAIHLDKLRDGNVGTECLHLPSLVTGDSAKRRSSFSIQTGTARDGAVTVVRFAGGRLALSKLEGLGFQSGIGHR
jgi:hypothetical protein